MKTYGNFPDFVDWAGTSVALIFIPFPLLFFYKFTYLQPSQSKFDSMLEHVFFLIFCGVFNHPYLTKKREHGITYVDHSSAVSKWLFLCQSISQVRIECVFS